MDSLTLNIGFSSSSDLDQDNNKKRKFKTTSKNAKRKIKVNSKYEENSEDDDEEIFWKLKKEKKANKTQHISSLFGHNPEIPSIETKDIKPVHEPVFSSKFFKDIGEIHPFMVKNLEETFGVTKVTTVQKLALPVLLQGSDALVRSQTGSGKTLAYAVPIVQALQGVRPKLSRADGIRAVVVLPTRELALQTYECFVKLMKSFAWLVPGIVVGGEKRKSEKARLRKGVNVLVGTPGRVIDHAQHTKATRLDQVEWLVLDEADRLLDLGYEREIKSLVELLDSVGGSTKRQTVLLSATLTARVEQLAGLALSAPVRLDASDAQESELVIPESLAQHYIVTPAKLRLVTLAAFIHWKCQVCKEDKMVVFMATQDMVDYHTELLSMVLAGSAQFLRLHGSMTQHDRTHVFKEFKAADAGVLLCTDVAARGLDLPSVHWIVQFTCPATPAEYVHRVGRTARVGLTGSAVLFLVPSETAFISKLQDKRIRLEEDQMVKCLYNLQTLEWEEDDGRVTGGLESAATALQLRFETAVTQQKQLYSLACKAYISWVRFYASYSKEARECFNFKELHLGHFAKSFALRDPPTAISGIGKPSFKQEGHDKRRSAGGGAGRREPQYRPKAPPRLREAVSEFDSGLPPVKKRKAAPL